MEMEMGVCGNCGEETEISTEFDLCQPCVYADAGDFGQGADIAYTWEDRDKGFEMLDAEPDSFLEMQYEDRYISEDY